MSVTGQRVDSDVAEVARRVAAEALDRRMRAEGLGQMRCVERDPEADADFILNALATLPDVRKALEEADVPCLHAPHLTCAPGDDLFHPECLLAALAP